MKNILPSDRQGYYHLFSCGSDSQCFISCEQDGKAAFNRVALCAALTGVIVLSFSIEDSHPHFLIFATYAQALEFARLYEEQTRRYLASNRGSIEGVSLRIDVVHVDTREYLMSVAAYTIVQPTKDGKRVMPYDYLWGTGSLYFRPAGHIPIWRFGVDGKIHPIKKFDNLSVRERRSILHSNLTITNNWQVCNGYILPSSYVAVDMFEQIYKTHNCFRVFMASNKSRDEEVQKRMMEARGIELEDLEARSICRQYCQSTFHTADVRMLSIDDRMNLARMLRHSYKMAFRQIAFLVHLPESELRLYIA